MSVMFNKVPDWLSGCEIVPSGYWVTAKRRRGEERRGGRSLEENRRLDLLSVKDTGLQRNDGRPQLVMGLLGKTRL